MILDDLADEWGVDVGDDGKTVWFALQVPGRRDGDTDGGDGARAEGAAP